MSKVDLLKKTPNKKPKMVVEKKNKTSMQLISH